MQLNASSGEFAQLENAIEDLSECDLYPNNTLQTAKGFWLRCLFLSASTTIKPATTEGGFNKMTAA